MLWEEYRLKVLKNRVLRKISGTQKKDVTGDRDNCMKRNFMNYSTYQILLERSPKGGSDGQGMWHRCESRKTHTLFCWGNLKERAHLEDPCIDGKIIPKEILKK
jgi:hypothetical protein